MKEPSEFIDSCYEILDAKIDLMPEKISYMFYYMKKDNWLLNYQFEWGLYKSISGIEKRISPSIDLEAFKAILNENKAAYFSEFDEFFKDILNESASCLKRL